MINHDNIFNWVGLAQYKNKKPFIFGTILASDEYEARTELEKLWERITPFDTPDFQPRKGMLIYKEGEYQND